MGLIDRLIFLWSIFLLVLGLIFTASGFGIFIVGRLEGTVLIISGIAMFWGGWIMSGARGFACAAASILNILDAASTVALWNFEANPIVLAAGPTLFLIAKVTSSLTIMFYAKLYPNPRKGGIALSASYAAIVGWNLSQHFRAYFGLQTFAYGIILGSVFSLLASVTVLYAIFLMGQMKKVKIKPLVNKIIAVCLIGLLAFSAYLTWENNLLNDYYGELYELYVDLTKKYNDLYDEIKFNLTLLMPKGLDEHYERIRAYESDKFMIKGGPGRLLFYVSQVLHDLGNYSYNQYCFDFNQTAGEECKNATEDFAINFLGYVDKSYPKAVNRIEQLYDWVHNFVSYVNDKNDFGRFPIETLTCRCGDCKDQAMALSLLLESAGYETALCLIHDKNLTKYGVDGLHRVFCAVRQTDFDYNDTLIQLPQYPQYGDSWIVLDPAFNHDFGEDPEWLGDYRTEDYSVYIPEAVLDSLLVDYAEFVIRAGEIGIILQK